MGGKKALSFEEGVDSYIPYAGRLKDNLEVTVSKNKIYYVQLWKY